MKTVNKESLTKLFQVLRYKPSNPYIIFSFIIYYRTFGNLSNPALLLNSWTGRKNVILIDAVLSGSAPGTIHRLELGKLILPAEFFKFSTHLFSIPQAIYLSASLGKLPDKIIILGIEGSAFETGKSISGEVKQAINNIENIVQEEIKKFQRKAKEEISEKMLFSS